LAKFCEECGTALGHTCPGCGSQVSSTARFCSVCAHPLNTPPRIRPSTRFVSPESYTPRHLAEKILTSKDGIEGERKQITVLFADIKGSMELIADRDPEDAQKILDPVLDRMMEAVHHYEGTVNRVMGDGIMALFGAPLAHEDHAVRACYASLRMQETVARYAEEVQRSHGVPVAIRVGLNSGEILVSGIGHDLHMDYIVVGHTVHLAARMEQLAEPGSVLTTADTLRLAESYVTAKPLGRRPVKGLPGTIEIYEIVGGGPARTRLQAAVRRGLTHFVDRATEITQLHHGLARARTAQGQIIAIVGQPGVGKSRLLHEFTHSREVADCLILESNTVSYGRSTPYLPVTDLLRNYFKTTAHETPRVVRERVTDKILAVDRSLEDAIPPMLDLLDALDEGHPFRSLEPLHHRQRTYQAITRLLSSEARLRPVIVLFEDLQWHDSLTLGLLNELILDTTGSRLLLLISYRPGFQDEWGSRPNYQQTALDPLASDNVMELLLTLLGSDPSLSTPNNLVVEHAGGNPLFVEEIVRTLVDTGVLDGMYGDRRLAKSLSSIEVPPTVQAVLAERIDALPTAEKRLLREASVIGYNVPYALLREICGLEDGELRDLLGRLQAAEFLYTTALFPELQYTFKHSLTHDVAYAGLLHERRHDIHARIVDAIERIYADRLGEQVERLARHALSGELWEKAIAYLRLAGARAADRGAYREATSFLEKALSALVQLPEERGTLEQAIDIRFEIRNALQPLGERGRIFDYLQEAEILANRLGDARRMGWIQSYFTDHFWILGRHADAMTAGERALVIGRNISDLALQVVTNLPLGLAQHTRGDYPRAIEHFQWNAQRLDNDHTSDRFGLFVLPSSFSYSFMGWALAELGDFDNGSLAAERGLQIAESARHPFSCGYAHLGVGVIALRRGCLQDAQRSFQRALDADGFADSPIGFSYVAFHLGYAQALSHRPEDGIPLLEQTVRIAESKGFVARHALRLAYLSEAYLISDRVDDATATATRALELANEHGERANQAYALRMIAEVDLYCHKSSEAEQRFSESLGLSQRLGMRPLQAHCHRGLAVVHNESQRSELAAFHRESAAALVDAMQMRFWGDPGSLPPDPG